MPFLPFKAVVGVFKELQAEWSIYPAGAATLWGVGGLSVPGVPWSPLIHLCVHLGALSFKPHLWLCWKLSGSGFSNPGACFFLVRPNVSKCSQNWLIVTQFGNSPALNEFIPTWADNVKHCTRLRQTVPLFFFADF